MSDSEFSELVNPPSCVSERSHVGSMSDYLSLYQKSIDDPEGFWSEVAEDFHWFSKWDQVRSYNYDRRTGPVSIEWFSGAKTNVCYNCVDRHLDVRPDKTAIIWEGNEPGEDATITFRSLHSQVCKFANVLKNRGSRKGTAYRFTCPWFPKRPLQCWLAHGSGLCIRLCSAVFPQKPWPTGLLIRTARL